MAYCDFLKKYFIYAHTIIHHKSIIMLNITSKKCHIKKIKLFEELWTYMKIHKL